MKWIDERPRPLNEAWNIVCDAIEERIEGLKVIVPDGYHIQRVSAVPSRKNYDIGTMRTVVSSLLVYSFLPNWFDKWINGEYKSNYFDGTLGFNNDMSHVFFKEFDIDPCAFFLRSDADVPKNKKSVNDFIHAIAKIINSAILYPAPIGWLNLSGYSSGFILDANLTLESLNPDYQYLWTGKWSDNGGKTIDVYPDADGKGLISAKNDRLVEFSHEEGRSRSQNLRWKYIGVGNRYRNTHSAARGIYGTVPKLLNDARLRTRNAYVQYYHYCAHQSGNSEKDEHAKDSHKFYNGGIYKVFDLPEQEYVIDFDAGLANKELDLSNVQSETDKIWNTKLNDRYLNYYTNMLLFIKDIEVYLTRDNYPELNYKYIC